MKGAVSYVYDEEEGNDVNIPFFTVAEGEYFGEIDCIFGQSRRFSAIATSDVDVLSLESNLVKELFFKDFPETGPSLKKKSLEKRKDQIRLFQKSKAAYRRVRRQERLAKLQRRTIDEVEDIIFPMLFVRKLDPYNPRKPKIP